ncbi:MAG TPA: DUF4410 domain-containing protein, partial [Burkholderiaceae bacterium]|nr:DUF4410 domain-containing protein [Burkholderiaceae bacterium]
MKPIAAERPSSTTFTYRRRHPMKLPRVCAALMLAAVLTGCAVNVTRSDGGFTPLPIGAATPAIAKHLALRMSGQQGGDWAKFTTEWREAIGDQAATSGMSFEYLGAIAAPTATVGTLLEVKISDYRYVSPAARFLLGIMTGNAFLDAQVSFIDLATGHEIGNKRYNTTSSAWEGIASPMSDRQIRAVASQIMGDLYAARPANSVPRTVAAKPTNEPQGKDAFAAERLAKAQSCNASP